MIERVVRDPTAGQRPADRPVVIRRAAWTLWRIHELDESILRAPILFRPAIDVHDAVVREQSELVPLHFWREPTVRLEPFFTPHLCLLVLIDELWVRYVLEFTHEHPSMGRLLGQQDEPAAQEDEETRVRLAGQLLQKFGHQLANLVGRHLHVRLRALLVTPIALLA